MFFFALYRSSFADEARRVDSGEGKRKREVWLTTHFVLVYRQCTMSVLSVFLLIAHLHLYIPAFEDLNTISVDGNFKFITSVTCNVVNFLPNLNLE